jgi:hypothetical protein
VGRAYLVGQGAPEASVEKLDLLGFSGICNLIGAIKFAKYYELGHQDVILTVLTDSMELYGSRLDEMRAEFGDYRDRDAAAHHGRYLKGISTDQLKELTYVEKRRVHNLKYFTWVEQQGRTYEEIRAQWYDRDYWSGYQGQVGEIDALIEEFNDRVGLKS